MARIWFLALICLLLLPHTLYADTNSSSQKDLYISEVNWAGSSNSTSDEWIELYNQSSVPIALNLYQLRIATSTRTDTYQLSGTINSNSYFVISGYGDLANTAVIDTFDLVIPAISLSNTTLKIELVKNSNGISEIIDIAGNLKAPLAGSTSPHTSMIRRIPLAAGDMSEAWLTSNITEGLKRLEDFGSPHRVNSYKPTINNFKCDTGRLVYNQENTITCSGDVISLDLTSIVGTYSINNDSITNPFIITNENTFSFASLFIPTTTNPLTITASVQSVNQINTVAISIPIVMRSSKIIITEIAADTDQGEWVEIKNDDNFPINLNQWVLDDIEDGGSKPFQFDNTIILESGQYYIIPASQSKIALNNDGDTVNLIDPFGLKVSSIVYTKAIKNQTFSWQNERSFIWTTNETPNTENTNAPAKPYSSNIQLNELLPNPEGDDTTLEWIELYNSSNDPVDITGWYIGDDSDFSHDFIIPNTITIPGNGYITLSRIATKISLNNSGETIYLFSPDGKRASVIEYPKAVEGKSYSNIDGTWVWTNNLTPNSENKAEIKVIEQSIMSTVVPDEPIEEPDIGEQTITVITTFTHPTIDLAAISYTPYLTSNYGIVLGTSDDRRNTHTDLLNILFSGIILCFGAITCSLWQLSRPSHNFASIQNNSPPH